MYVECASLWGDIFQVRTGWVDRLQCNRYATTMQLSDGANGFSMVLTPVNVRGRVQRTGCKCIGTARKKSLTPSTMPRRGVGELSPALAMLGVLSIVPVARAAVALFSFTLHPEALGIMPSKFGERLIGASLQPNLGTVKR